MNNIDKVREFLLAFGQDLSNKPEKKPSPEKIKLAFTLILEELCELLEEFGPDIATNVTREAVTRFLEVDSKVFGNHIERIRNNQETDWKPDYSQILKEAVDLEVVLHNLTNFLGLHPYYQQAYDGVCKNNMQKICLDGDHADRTEDYYKQQGVKVYTVNGPDIIVKRYEDDKIMKPVGFKKYDPADLLRDKSIIENWECTDPDALQFAFKEAENTWTYKQYDFTGYSPAGQKHSHKDKQTIARSEWDDYGVWTQETISLSDYNPETAWGAVCGYYSREEFSQMWNRKGNWKRDGWQIICECIFETEHL